MNSIFFSVRKSKIIYTLSIFTGLLVAIFGLKIYEDTLISIWILILLSTISTTIGFYFIKAHYKKTYNVNSDLYPFFQSLFSIGLITVSLFLIINKQLAEIDHLNKQFEVQKIGHFSGRSKQTYAMINYDGLKKQLLFKQETDIVIRDIIQLLVTKGYFGYDVIIKKSILK